MFEGCFVAQGYPQKADSQDAPPRNDVRGARGNKTCFMTELVDIYNCERGQKSTLLSP